MSKEFKVGLLALVAGVLLYLGFNFLKGSDFMSRDNEFYVIYSNVDGLTVSNPVMLNGLAVGRVSEIKILQNQGNKLLVKLDIDDKIRITDSTVALLGSSDLLGSKAVMLEVKTSRKYLESGDTISAGYQTGITQILKEKGVPLLEHVDSLTYRLAAVFDPEMRNNLQGVVADLRTTMASLRRIMNDNEAKIGSITSNLDRLSNSLNGTAKKLDPILADMNAVTDSLRRADLPSVIRNADQAVSDMKNIMARIERGEGSAGKLLKNDSLYNNLSNAAESLDRLLIDLRRNPKRYVHFSVFGRKDRGPKNDEERGKR